MTYFEKLIEFKKGKSYDYAAIPRVTVMAKQDGDKLHFTVSRHSPSNYPENKTWQFTKAMARKLCEERFDAKKYYASVPMAVVPVEEPVQTGVDSNRFKQIFDILSAERNQMYDNSPDEVVAGIESVTTHAGGGQSGPKNPADIKSNSISMYPDWQARK